jgi:hypothetical protein
MNPIVRKRLAIFGTITFEDAQCAGGEQTLQDFAAPVTILHFRGERLAATSACAIVVTSQRF